jgi:hypothetical protein
MTAARPSAVKLRRSEVAAWGHRPNTAPDRPKLRLISWKPLNKKSLRGFATLQLPIGRKVSDCRVFVSNGKAWASVQSKPQIDREGRQKTDGTGKVVYAPVLEWRSRDLADRFSDAVVALVRAEHPGDLVGGAP